MPITPWYAIIYNMHANFRDVESEKNMFLRTNEIQYAPEKNKSNWYTL